MELIAPASGFVLYEDGRAVRETLAGRLQITDPAITARYARRLGLLRQAASPKVQAQNYAARPQAHFR